MSKETRSAITWLVLLLVGIMLGVLIFAVSMFYAVNILIAVNGLITSAEIPETEAVETTECTSAPDSVTDTSMPEVEETIPEVAVEVTVEAVSVEKKEPEPIPEPEPPAIDKEDLEMLACVIYQEAGGDMHCDECRRRVADVVLNRMSDDRFPDTMYEVLTQKDQYGRFYKTGIRWPSRAKQRVEAHAVNRAYRIAEEVLSGHHSDLYGEGYVWQATFKQSNDNIYCCGHYFGR